MPTITTAAPAKINLYLHVTGRRDDGYHLLDSLMAFAGIGDVVTAETANDLKLEIDGPFGHGLPTDSSNLVIQAAVALQKLAGITDGARLRLTKNLPLSSGIGGGSADAAATFRALIDLWDVKIDENELMNLGAGLGADIPVCLTGAPSQVSGVGEIVMPAPRLPDAWLVLVNHGIPVSTPDVFNRRTGEFSKPAPILDNFGDVDEFAAALTERRNDLTDAAIEVAPAIERILFDLSELPGALLSRLSGSGATCFALMRDEPSARYGVMAMEEFQPTWWIEAAPLLNHSGIHPKDLTS